MRTTSARTERSRRTPVVLALLFISSSLAACGLRVDNGQQLSQSQTSGQTGKAPGTGLPGTSANTPGAVGIGPRPATGAGSAAVAGSATSTGSASSPAGVGTLQSGAGTPTMSRGVTASTITIGMQVSKNLQAGFTAVGASGSPADESEIVDALTKWVNGTGGLAGRKLIVIKHQTDETSGTWASQASSACADFTQDHHVFAVGSSPVGGSDALLSCLASAGTPDIEQNLWLFDEPYYRQYPDMLYQPGRASPDRWAKAYADGLDAEGFFNGPNTKVGLLRFDAPVFQRIADSVLKPEMARLGHKFDAEISVHEPAGVSDFGGMAAQFNNAIVTLRTKGINHVMFLENAGEMPFFFMEQADSQGYRPIYGLTSNDIPDTLAGQEPSSQLQNSVVVGWTPPNDVGNAHDPGANPAHELCRKILTKYGVKNQTGFYAQSECDTFFFLRKVLPTVRQFSPIGLASSTAALGTSYDSPFTFRTRFSAGRHDGADAYRLAFYSSSCSCFQYSGPTHPM
jgi:hypothetical protein